MLQLTVRDDGPGIVAGRNVVEGCGVGIRNTRERLQVLYGDYSRMTVNNAEPGLSVMLQFPAELADTPPIDALAPAKVPATV
jgi:signal transduction histidine kinase